jgi:hypothetical protein
MMMQDVDGITRSRYTTPAPRVFMTCTRREY